MYRTLRVVCTSVLHASHVHHEHCITSAGPVCAVAEQLATGLHAHLYSIPFLCLVIDIGGGWHVVATFFSHVASALAEHVAYVWIGWPCLGACFTHCPCSAAARAWGRVAPAQQACTTARCLLLASPAFIAAPGWFLQPPWSVYYPLVAWRACLIL